MLSPGAEQEKIFAKRRLILPGGNFGLARRETSAAGTLAVPKDRYAVRWEGSYKP